MFMFYSNGKKMKERYYAYVVPGESELLINKRV